MSNVACPIRSPRMLKKRMSRNGLKRRINSTAGTASPMRDQPWRIRIMAKAFRRQTPAPPARRSAICFLRICVAFKIRIGDCEQSRPWLLPLRYNETADHQMVKPASEESHECIPRRFNDRLTFQIKGSVQRHGKASQTAEFRQYLVE